MLSGGLLDGLLSLGLVHRVLGFSSLELLVGSKDGMFVVCRVISVPV